MLIQRDFQGTPLIIHQGGFCPIHSHESPHSQGSAWEWMWNIRTFNIHSGTLASETQGKSGSKAKDEGCVRLKSGLR